MNASNVSNRHELPRRHFATRAIVVAMLNVLSVTVPAISAASPCDAYFKFDGNLADSSGNGYDGQMISEDVVATTPRFAEGKIGQALRLNGGSAMRAFLDLHFDACPQVTIAAWLRVDANDIRGSQDIISTGSGNGPGVRINGTSVILTATANGLWQRNAIRGNAEWVFVAGVWDYPNMTYRLYWRTRSLDGKMGNVSRPPEEAIWVGAFNDGLTNPPQNVLIDDLHIYGRALNADEIRSLQAATATEPRPEPTSAGQTVSESGSTIPSGTESASPVPAPGSNQATVDSGGASSSPAAGVGSAIPGFNTGLSGASDAVQDRLEENRPPEIGYDSEEEGIAAAEGAAERRRLEREDIELARQQNELEQERREEQERQAQANSEDSSAGSKTAYLGGVQVTRLGSAPVESPLSGITGSSVARLDLVTQTILAVSIDERLDRPCRIRIAAGFPRSSASPRVLELDRCGSGFSVPVLSGGPTGLSPGGDNYNWGVTSLQVGDIKGPRSVFAVKGLWLEWTEISDFNGLTGAQNSDNWKLPTFDSWQQRVSCPANHVATGLVAHFYPGKGLNSNLDRLAGLKLICREVLAGRE